jgi:MFS family permease
MAFLVRERERKPVSHISFGERFRLLPASYKSLLCAVSLAGAGGFAHTLLILLATQRLTPRFGASKAASLAVALYVLHNVVYAACSYLGGWLGDRLSKKWMLAGAYGVGALMSGCIIALPPGLWSLSIIFILGGVNMALMETMEDSYCAELVDEAHHGTAFGLLATVNGVGDFVSSIAVGLLWSAIGTTAAFGCSAALFAAGACLLARRR